MKIANAHTHFEQVGVELALDSEGEDLFYRFTGFSIKDWNSKEVGKGS